MESLRVAGGTDGASMNISEQNGMRGTMQGALTTLAVFGMVLCSPVSSVSLEIVPNYAAQKTKTACFGYDMTHSSLHLPATKEEFGPTADGLAAARLWHSSATGETTCATH